MAVTRPYKDVYLHVRIAHQEKVKFENVCARNHEVPADVVRRLVREYTNQGVKK